MHLWDNRTERRPERNKLTWKHTYQKPMTALRRADMMNYILGTTMTGSLCSVPGAPLPWGLFGIFLISGYFLLIIMP